MDYLTVMANIEDAEWKKFRSKMHSKASMAMRYSREAAEFYCMVCIKGNGLAKLWSHIKITPFVDLLVKHFDILFANNKLMLLVKLSQLSVAFTIIIMQFIINNYCNWFLIVTPKKNLG